MFERLWRRDALRVHLLSQIGVVVASAVVLVAGQPATAQEFFDFEDPPYTGSAGGTVITNQDDFYIPVPNSQDGLVYTYAGNALGLPPNPSGGGEQFAGVTGGDPALPVPFARAQRNVVYGAGTGVWTVSFDIAVTFTGVLPSSQNIGSFSTQLFPTEATYIALARWTDPATAAEWNADYVWFNAPGGQLTEAVPDPGFQNLLIDHWYRWSTTFNLNTNQILQVSITDLSPGGLTFTHNPEGRYLVGGAAGGAAPPSGFRLFGGALTVAGNTLAFDNIDIDLASGTPFGACCFEGEICDFLTEADCAAGDGAYQGDWIGCGEQTCITIPEACIDAVGSCNEVHPEPGCETPLCCALVCIQDPFCCAVSWGPDCVALAGQLGECAEPPPVDFCAAPFNTEITQNADNVLIDTGGVACQGGNITTENSWARAYDLSLKLPGQEFSINCVEFAMSSSDSGVLVGTVTIYEDTDGGEPEAPGVDLVVLGSKEFFLPAFTNLQLFQASFDPPVVAPADSTIVVVIDLPPATDGFAVYAGNSAGQSRCTYLLSESCGILTFICTDVIKFPDLHMLQTIRGDVKGGPPCPADIDGPDGVPGAPVPDGVVGVHDLLFLIGVWGDCPLKGAGGCPADLDGPDGVPGAPVPDGVVGVHDLLFLIGVWGDCPA